MHIYQLLLRRKGPRLVKPTRRGILLLFPAQKQKYESSRLLNLKQTNCNLEIEFHADASNPWST